jgi:cellulose biosynthesis protein BcsQ
MNKSYVMWNNKGGVGKSTITFHVASVYAEKHPEEDVIVVDLCPQANVSMMLIGGGQSDNTIQKLITNNPPHTIVGYLTESILNGTPTDLSKYLTQISEYNNNLTSNIYLISGDGNLELLAPLLSQRAEATAISAADRPWIRILSLVKDLTKLRIDQKRNCTFFIDTNPSFSIYTQLAIVGAQRLLVPINADDSSIYAITGLFNLIWGTKIPHPVYGKYTFASKAKENDIILPRIALLLGNRFTQKVGAAHAFKALSDEAINKLYEEYKENSSRFMDSIKTINSLEDFSSAYSVELRDFNSAGVVAANLGIPMTKMNKSYYSLYGRRIDVELKQRELCKTAIEELVDRL